MFIAGHIGFESQWHGFAQAWNFALGPQRKRLHMRDLRWSSNGTKKLLARLGPIPAQCGLKRLVGGVRVADYEDLIPGPKAQKALTGYACAVLAIGVTLVIGSIPEGEQYDLVFERQDRYFVQARIALETLAKNPNPLYRNKNGQFKISNWSQASKESTALFDQADYLCYAFAHRHKAPQSQRALWTTSILESNTDTIGRIMTRDEIREAVMHEPFAGSNKV